MGIVPLPQSYSDYGFDFGTRSAPVVENMPLCGL